MTVVPTYVDYVPQSAGVDVDPVPNGGAVSRLRLWTGANADTSGTATYDVGPAVRIAATVYRFSLSVEPSLYTAIFTWQLNGSAPSLDDPGPSGLGYGFYLPPVTVTHTYSGSPSTSSLDQVRFLVGDTDTSDWKSSDQEILWAVAQEGNSWFAAADVAEAISARFAIEVEYGADGATVGTDQLQAHYADLATRLRQSGRRRATGLPYTGGISRSDIDAVNNDSDRAGVFIQMGMHDNFRAGMGGPVTADVTNPLVSPPAQTGGQG